MAKTRSRLADYSVYLLIRMMVCVAQMLTIDQSYEFARILGKILYRLDARHRKIGIENLKSAFGDKYNDYQRDQLVRKVFEHFSTVLMEILHIPRKLDPTTWRERITLVGHEKVVDRLLAGGPVIMLTGHFGNWEMAGYLFGVFGFPPSSVARSLDNPYLDNFLRTFRERTGQKMIPKNGGYDQMLEVLRDGGILSFLADQDAGLRGLYVDFFGRPASTHKAIALLAIEHNAPVVVGYARRIGPGFRYEVGCDDIIEPSEWQGSPDDVRRLTQRYTTSLETLIRKSPEQYLWLHRRWKNQPKPKKSANSRPRTSAEEPASSRSPVEVG